MSNRIAYTLDEFTPSKSSPDRYLVLVVTDGEAGYRRTGNEGQGVRPWYWSRENCAAKNAKLGLSPTDVSKIIASSMRGGTPTKRSAR